MSPWQINRLGKAVLQGAVFAYPTDTIWGFGCHPLDAIAVQQILDIKQRSVSKGLILLASDLQYIEPYISHDISDRDRLRLQQVNDQPTTWLVEANPDCPYWLRGEFTTIAIRLTNHSFVKQMCDSIRAPLVSTSANRSGKSPVRNAIQAHRQFAGELDFIVHGFHTGGSKASEIKSLETEKSIRTS
jgi:L-threonylcarbamoyladenylate synthase